MRSCWRYFLAGAAITVLAAAVAHVILTSEFERRAQAAEALADSLQTVAAHAVARADSAEARVDTIEVRVAVRDTVIRRIMTELPVPTVQCLKETAPRDSIIRLQDQQIADLQVALDEQQSATTDLRSALDATQEALDSTLSALSARPRFTFAPEITLGGFAGICTTGQPCAGLGVGIGFRIPIKELFK